MSLSDKTDRAAFLNYQPILIIVRMLGLLSAPQDLPYSPSLLLRLLAVYVVTGMMVLIPGVNDLFTAVALLLLDLVLLFAFLKFCLYTRNHSERFLQTLLACLGVGIFFQLLALPLVLVLNSGVETSQANSALGGLFYLMLVSWQITIIAHILRHAMNMLMGLTLLLSFSYLLVAIFLSNQITAYLAAS